MPVSEMSEYSWQCSCGSSNKDLIWRLLHAQERSDVIAGSRTGVSHVECSTCGKRTPIEAPILVCHLNATLQLLLGLSQADLADPQGQAEILGRELYAALGGTDGITGPILPLPREILEIALKRDIDEDMRHPDSAIMELRQLDENISPQYEAFLNDAIESATPRSILAALNDFWSVPPDQIEEFLHQHPELATDQAVMHVRHETSALPEGYRNEPPPRARERLIEQLAAGIDIPSVANEYRQAMNNFWSNEILPELDQLMDQLSIDPSPDLIPLARRALEICHGDQTLERQLSVDLATRLLRLVGVSRDDLTEAISLLEKAREISNDQDSVWIRASGNLGSAIAKRADGDPIEIWEKTIAVLTEASSPHLKHVDEQGWATNQTNLAHALCIRPGGSTAEDLSQALNALQSALQVRSPDRNLIDWGYTQLQLGIAYFKRNQGDDLLRAKECHRAVLSELRSDDDENLWVTHQYNLANVLISTESPVAPEAEHALCAGLAVAREPVLRGLLYRRLADFLEKQHGSLASTVVEARSNAVRLLDPYLEPEYYLDVGEQLAEALQELNRWDEAADQYERSWTAFKALYDSQLSISGRRDVVVRYERLSRWAAYCIARAGRLHRAAEIIEHGRTMELSVTLSRERADLSALSKVDSRLAERYIELIQQYRELASSRLDFSQAEQAARESRAVENTLRETIKEIRRVPGFESFLEPIKLDDIAKVAVEKPILYLVASSRGCYVITIQYVEDTPKLSGIHLDELTGRLISRLVLIDLDEGHPGLLAAQTENAAHNALETALSNLHRLQPLGAAIASESKRLRASSVIVVPTGLLGFIPLSVLQVDTDGNEVVDDLCLLTIAPSISTYIACKERKQEDREKHLVGVADTDIDNPLPGSVAELESIQNTFSMTGLTSVEVGNGATLDWVSEHASLASILHFACHGYSSIEDPWGGGLILAGGSRLRPPDLVRTFRLTARLVVLSACQSGHYSATDGIDESIGLVTAFLEAGSSCVIATLWPVFDDSTALLMTRFYESMLFENLDPPEALHNSRQWLRRLSYLGREEYLEHRPTLADAILRQGLQPVRSHLRQDYTKPYSSPECWGAFVAYGS